MRGDGIVVGGRMCAVSSFSLTRWKAERSSASLEGMWPCVCHTLASEHAWEIVGFVSEYSGSEEEHVGTLAPLAPLFFITSAPVL